MKARNGDNKYELVGVTSGCALPGIPGVYGRVSSVVDWISHHTNVV